MFVHLCHIEPLLSTLICSIELPITLPRSSSMFDRELDYYEIASTHGIAEHESLAKTSLSFIELLDPSKASRVFPRA